MNGGMPLLVLTSIGVHGVSWTQPVRY